MKLSPEIQKLLDFKKNYCEKYQVIYTDTHLRGDILLIGEVFKLIGHSVMCIEIEKPEPIKHDIDIYGGQVPNTGIDYNKRGNNG
jgi:hypothetical protein